MKTRFIVGVLALTVSTTAFASEPAPAPEKQCCCCKKGEDGKMACSMDKDAKADPHAGHDMSHMDHADKK